MALFLNSKVIDPETKEEVEIWFEASDAVMTSDGVFDRHNNYWQWADPVNTVKMLRSTIYGKVV